MRFTTMNNLSTTVTVEDIKRAIPSRKNTITQELVDIINQSLTEPEFQGESLLETASTYERVIQSRAGTSVKDYIYAIKFCAYLVGVDDNFTEAYRKTFFSRDFVKERANAPTDSVGYKELTAAASRYRRSKLVVDILTLSQVPLDMLFTGQRYRAVLVLADRMENSRMDKDKIAAAKELLAATKGPDNLKIELDVGVKENSAVQQLNEQLAMMAAKQRTMLESGVTSLKELGGMKVAADDVIEGVLVDE